MPLVSNSLRNGHAHTQTCIPTFMDKAVLRNQVQAGLRPVCIWFKNTEVLRKAILPTPRLEPTSAGKLS